MYKGLSLSTNKVALLKVSMLAATACFSAMTQADEPNWKGNPVYGTVSLAAGFTPDPWVQDLQAGGGREVTSSLAPGCKGFINYSRPDVDFNFSGSSAVVYIHVESDADTTLVVNAPDGRWYCNDDFIGLNPMVIFQNPREGQYNIWVGVHGAAELHSAKLKVTEVKPAMR
ncbi:peptidase S1 [Alkalimonas sp. MEB108]|uniref:Peptidase S1 n=1 Tax=Alkalimonas cellulosilytica TaxID=3058395 RepID=A0ABU7J6V9_9GAMM|nr:peptidase S1 [Alkalimonas sp. MEB108]MEE2001747.1 peptidase S1 [Alkalimonas sp. MEB108]